MERDVESVLKKWKESSNRLPIILRGARQVGKSFIVEKFGRENFESTVTINFEFKPDFISCFDDLDPKIICSKLELRLQDRIIMGKTLLFLDEIQNCPQAILALRYFKEKMPGLHVIAAGSLLEFTLKEEKFSFPVGRVEFLYVKPLSFREYLLGRGFQALVDFLGSMSWKDKVDASLHEHLQSLVKEYFIIGGMPAVVQSFIDDHSFLECQKKQSDLLDTYRNDFSKYATKTQHKYLQRFFEKAPSLIGSHFRFSHIDPDIRSRELKVALEQLMWAGLLYPIKASSASGIPLHAHAKENQIKLLFLDMGLVNSANHLQLDTIWNNDLFHLLSGAQAEQFVGQELLAYPQFFSQSSLFFWKREKAGSMAEVDYVIECGSFIVPIEVKAGTTGSLRSLGQFMEEKKSSLGIRISQHELSFHEKILSVPFYLIDQIPRFVKEILLD